MPLAARLTPPRSEDTINKQNKKIKFCSVYGYQHITCSKNANDPVNGLCLHVILNNVNARCLASELKENKRKRKSDKKPTIQHRRQRATFAGISWSNAGHGHKSRTSFRCDGVNLVAKMCLCTHPAATEEHNPLWSLVSLTDVRSLF